VTKRLREQVAARSPFPPGSATVAAWLVVTGLSAYAFLTFAGRVLGSDAFGPLAVLWACVFFAGPGFFQPLEQEVSRALSERRARGLGGAPLIRRAMVAGGVLATALAAMALVVGLAVPAVVDSVFDGEQVLVYALAASLIAYFVEHLARGVMSGLGRFNGYGMLMGSEGILRLLAAFVLALVGVETAGPYGLALAFMPFAATALTLTRERGLLEPGPPAPWSELTRNVGLLLAGSLFALALLNAGPVIVQLLATDAQDDAAGSFLAGLLLARVPLYFFQAVQAALLPKLSGQRGVGEHAEFKTGLRRLLLAVAAISVVSIIGSTLFGPWAVSTFFGEDFEIGSSDMALLALGASLLMVALTLAQALIALEHHGRAAIGWASGVAVFALGIALTSGLFRRVEIGYVFGTGVAALVMAALLVPALRDAGSVDAEELAEAIASEPLEL
jgi:O-antigen/teichoic acid export membrane protein